MSAALHALAEAAGLCRHWDDVAGVARTVDDQDLRTILQAMDLPAATTAQCIESRRRLDAATGLPPLLTAEAGGDLPLPGGAGHRLCLEAEDGHRVEAVVGARGVLRAPAQPGDWRFEHAGRTHTLAVAPLRCFGVSDAVDAAAPRAWGVGVQVHATRHDGDGGLGDAAGVADWAQRVAAAGGDALALSPVHAARPVSGVRSPYAPSDRRFFEPTYAAPALVLDRTFVDATCGGLDDPCAEAELIDWEPAVALRWARLRALYAARAHLPEPVQADLAAFERDGGDALAAFARHAAADHGEDDAGLHRFAQWLAARSWTRVQADARARGMALGLIADVAVGFDPNGAEAAAAPDAVLRGLELGAPPDAFNAAGQTWGVGGFDPAGLRRTGFAPVRALLRATMCNRGGVRIDHILGLLRLWLVPRGAPSSAGAYLRAPLHDLLNLVALESWRQRCIVIGEDLGVVPPGLRETLARRGVMGIDVLAFTRDADGAFLPPHRWRREAVATTTTHDLPTLVGWSRGRDLDWRARLEGTDAATLAGQRDARAADVRALDAASAAAIGETGPAAWMAFVAASPSPLALLPAEDALGLPEQPNLPGTVDTHPNWRRRLPRDADPAPALTAFAAARALPT